MQRVAGQLLFSPSDLVEFLESPFASWMSRCALDRPELRPGRDPADASALPGADALLKRRGLEHERRVLEGLCAAGRDVLELDPNAAGARQQTLDALRAGREVIYQASLAHEPFAGIADFLVRVPGASRLGEFHYEVWDAKLARRAKPTHALQLCAYAEMLEAVQGVRAAELQVELAGGRRERLRGDDFRFFHRSARAAFLAFMAGWSEAEPPPPDPGAEHRRWQEAAERWLEERDALCRVAFSTRLQARRLAAVGIETLGALADTRLERVAGLEDRVLARLREQAALQRASAGRTPPLHRVLREEEVEEGRGLALLPPASPGDLIFDLEGDPLEEGGLEYLWGTASRGRRLRRRRWAHDARGERAAVEGFLDALALRRARHPDLHVYHYGAYELAALKRLAAREETREEVLDALLRAQVFVDLYPIVRHGLRVGEPSYSLKNVERLVRPPREGERGERHGVGRGLRRCGGRAGRAASPAARRSSSGSAATTRRTAAPPLRSWRGCASGRRRRGSRTACRGRAGRTRAKASARIGAAAASWRSACAPRFPRRPRASAGGSRRCWRRSSSSIAARRAPSGGSSTTAQRWTRPSAPRSRTAWRGCGAPAARASR